MDMIFVLKVIVLGLLINRLVNFLLPLIFGKPNRVSHAVRSDEYIKLAREIPLLVDNFNTKEIDVIARAYYTTKHFPKNKVPFELLKSAESIITDAKEYLEAKQNNKTSARSLTEYKMKKAIFG